MNRVLLRRVLERRQWVERLATSGSLRDHGTHASDGDILISCVALERLPLVMPAMPAWEREYKDWQTVWNARRYKELPQSFTTSDVKMTDDGKTSGRATWEPSSLQTSADARNDVKSLQRKLDQRLFLLVKKDGAWDFVQSAIQNNDTSTRKVAERALESLMGENASVRYYFIGNAPAAHTRSEGGTKFFHRCQLIHIDSFSSVDMKEYEDYAWVSPNEFEEYLEIEQAKVLQQMA